MAPENNFQRKPSVFIAEDEMITSAYLRRVLVRLGYEVAGLAASGASALEQIQRTRPDVLIADVGLKGDMDGLELAARVLENWRIPVVFLTAYSDPETQIRARPAEPYGFIVKPFAEQDLHTAIEAALQRKNGGAGTCARRAETRFGARPPQDRATE